MEKVYFAGKFNLLKNKNQTLEERLVNDYRAYILSSSKKLTYATENLKLDDKYIYKGPFYCEQASNGDFTSTDCNTVINAEYNAIKDCDIYFAFLDENFSVGTIVELGWAINMDKKIIIFYKEEASKYQIKSEYWFAIADAMKRSNKVKVCKIKDTKAVVNKIKEGSAFCEI